MHLGRSLHDFCVDLISNPAYPSVDLTPEQVYDADGSCVRLALRLGVATGEAVAATRAVSELMVTGEVPKPGRWRAFDIKASSTLCFD